MKKRVGTKLYDTEKADLIHTLPDGKQIYYKRSSSSYFQYDPEAKNKYEMFRDIPPEETGQYASMTAAPESDKVFGSSSTLKFSGNERNRIHRLATANGMSMKSFIMLLVDEYERGL